MCHEKIVYNTVLLTYYKQFYCDFFSLADILYEKCANRNI